MTRLSPERLDEIFRATLELVATRGFSSTTMDAIAEHAHCSKATLYRQWETKVGLVVEAMEQLKPDVPLPDTGTFRGDLHALVSGGIEHVLDSGQLIIAILHAASQDPELRQALHARMGSDEHRGEVEQLVDRAVARGEIQPDAAALPYVTLVFLAPMVLQPLLADEKLTATVMNDYLDATLIPLLGLRAD
ncbi:MAG: TetR/AcrR family transcriptional regulator [Aeromicrobium sp.]